MTSLPPVWGEKAKWMGELGRVACSWLMSQLVRILRTGWVCRGRSSPFLQNALLPETIYLTFYDLWEKKNKDVERDGFQKQKKQSTNCFQQWFFYSCSCFFFFLLLFYFFKILKLESSVAPHTASFFRLTELYTLWNPAWMIQKIIIIIATMRSKVCWGKFTSVLSVVVHRDSLFWIKTPFCFSLTLSSVYHPSLCTLH